MSAVRARPHAFVAVNCAALTESLLEAELFGHAKGAFTGAAGARAGLIEHAEGGTLFLDEIGTLSKSLQAKLLRALESGEVRRIGENDSRHVDVRFVAATNIDLKSATAAGEFRSDLYYRIHVHHVHLPPLRERTGDIPLLVNHFLSRNARGASAIVCSPAAMEVLSGYSYPGNVRQLEHIIQRAVATARASELTPGRSARGAAGGADRIGPGRRHGGGGAREGRARDDRRDAGQASRRDRRRRARAAGEPHHDVAADEEARHRGLSRGASPLGLPYTLDKPLVSVTQPTHIPALKHRRARRPSGPPHTPS